MRTVIALNVLVADTPDGREGWICNDCRFHKKEITDWVIEGPSKINRHSVISANHYEDGVSGLKMIQFDTRMALARRNHEVEARPNGHKAQLGEGALNPNNQPV
jgi:hypothetical protein